MAAGAAVTAAKPWKRWASLASRLRPRDLALVFASATALLAAARHLGPILLRRFLARVLGLARPRPGGIVRLGGLRVPLPGSEYLATVAYARAGGGPAPTFLVRTPYNKHVVEVIAYAVAAQGFNVVVQDCRGRYASTGQFTFGAFEDEDGVATLDWFAEQGFEWYDPDRVVMFGISYLGIVQWAMVAGLERRRQRRHCQEGAPEVAGEAAGEAGKRGKAHDARLVAITPLFSASHVHDAFFHNNAFKLDFYLRYVHLMTRKTDMFGQVSLLYQIVRFEALLSRCILRCLGMRRLHQKCGLPVLFKYNPRPQSRFWKNRDYSDARPYSPPALIATGWHDLFLGGALNDYKGMVEAHGVGYARLMVGPWHHLESVLSLSAFRTLLRSSVSFLQEKTGLAEATSVERLPVRLWVMGKRAHQGCWQDFSAWPPNEVSDALLMLGYKTLDIAGCLDQHPAARQLSCIKYDPRDPTPAVGGSVFNPSQAGERLQTSLEARDDVLLFDSEPFATSVTIVGQARLRLLIRASRPHFDVFARLCDVHPGTGRSYNVCDAAVRHVAPAERAQSHQEVPLLQTFDEEQPCTVTVELTFAATAKCFGQGHRLRLLVAGGAFPNYARHFGDVEQNLENEPLEVHTTSLEVLHTEQMPSALWIPVLASVPDAANPSGPCWAGSPRSLKQAATTRPARLPKKQFADGLRKIQSEAVVA